MMTLFNRQIRQYVMGGAILLVLLHHVVGARISDSLIYSFFGGMFVNGSIGVNVFFLLSAYGLCHSLEKNTLLTFFRNRFIRILPTYLLFLVVYWGFSHDEAIFTKMLHALSSFAVFSGSNVDWYVPSQLFVYYVFPFLFWGIITLYNKNKAFIYLLFILVYLAEFKLYHYMQPRLAYRLPCILVGIVFYLFEKEHNEEGVWAFALFCACFSFLNIWQYSYFYLPLLLLCMVRVNKFPFFPFISWMGKYSLEIYLGQYIGLEYYFHNTQGNLIFDLFQGICVTVIVSGLFITVRNIVVKYNLNSVIK